MRNTIFRTFSTLVILLLVVGVSANPQNYDNISGAIRTGNASALASNFEGNVEITIKGDGGSYSKSQAEMVLKNFFTKNTPKGFTVVHSGNSPDGSKYFIGNFSTSTGTYRTFVLLKKGSTTMVIQEIRFEEQ